jgi:hypothetical protein
MSLALIRNGSDIIIRESHFYLTMDGGHLDSMKHQLNKFVLTLVQSLFMIASITSVFMIAIIADYLILTVINWTFGDTIKHNTYAALILEGIHLLSALGAAAVYALYLIKSLIDLYFFGFRRKEE